MSQGTIAHFTVGETRCLGIPIGEASGRGTALSKILGLKSSPGWLVSSTGAAEWRFTSTAQRNGQVFLYGPEVSGRSLDGVLALPLPEALPYLSRLADALAVLEQKGKLRFALQTDAVLFTDDGSVLILPPEVIREIRGLSPFALNAETFEAINHPDLQGPDQGAFALASMLYRLIAGRFPFTGNTAEEIHEQARKLEVLAPDRVLPGLDPEVSSCVMIGIGRPRGQKGRRVKAERLGVADWAARLSAWRSMRLVRELEAGEKEGISRESTRSQADQLRRFRRRAYWTKNWKVALVVALVVVGVGGALASYLSRALAPRPTKGFPPRKVVETFYLSMNRMDSILMEACVVDKAGKGEIGEITNLFVVSRVTLSQEGRSYLVAADEWDARGRPALRPPETVLGVTNLSITEEKPEPEPVFIAEYEKWSPLQGETEGVGRDSVGEGPGFEGIGMKDRVFMRMDKGDWVIYRIDHLGFRHIAAPR